MQYEEPYQLFRTVSNFEDEAGNQFAITVTGPEEYLAAYVDASPILLEVLPQEEPEKIERGRGRENLEKEPMPIDLKNTLEVDIVMAKTVWDGPYTLKLTIDPDIAQNTWHCYNVFGARSVQVDCDTSLGDADLYLYEVVNGTEHQRDRSLAPGTQQDSVSFEQGNPTNWKVCVYGFLNSTYSLSGSVNVF
jgi:hypothetical protein